MKKTPDYKTPFATLYYADARGGLPIASGACRTPKSRKAPTLANVKQAAMRQVWALEKYRRVEVVERKTGTLVFSVSMPTGADRPVINVDCAGRVADNYQWREKMKAKQAAAKAKRKGK